MDYIRSIGDEKVNSFDSNFKLCEKNDAILQEVSFKENRAQEKQDEQEYERLRDFGASLRQLTTEQRVDAVRSVLGSIVYDLTDVDVDFSKTVFDNGMHSLNAVELLSRLNQTLGTGVTTKLVVNDAPMADFAVAVAIDVRQFRYAEVFQVLLGEICLIQHTRRDCIQ